MKKVIMVLAVLGVMSSVQADEVARGSVINLANVSTTQEFFPSVLNDSAGEKGYLAVVIDEEITRVLPPVRNPNAPLGISLALNSACSFTPADIYGGQALGVRVVNVDAEYVNDQEVSATVVMLMGDPSSPSVLSCNYKVGLDDVNEYGQEIFSVDYLQDKGYLLDAFDFDVDAHQLMLDTSVAV